MENQFTKGRFARRMIRLFSLVALGSCLYVDPADLFNPYQIGFGVIVCLFIGILFKGFLKAFISLFNGKVRKEFGSGVIAYIVENGMMYMLPFSFMALLATFFLEWSIATAFISTGFMAVGTATAIEIGKLQEKKNIKNTLVTSAVSFGFSFLLSLSIPMLSKGPGYIEGIIGLIPTFLGKGGGF